MSIGTPGAVMREEELIAAFRSLDLFAEFDGEQLKLLAFVSEDRALAAGEVLYRAGDRPDGAYVLVSGALDAVHPEQDGGARHTITPPALVGEMGLMLTRPRATTIEAQRSSRLLFVPREPFLKLLRNDPELAECVAGTLRAELVRYLDQVTRIKPQLTRH